MDSKEVEKQEYQVPEWEHVNAQECAAQGTTTKPRKKSLRALFAQQVDKVIPPQRTYLRMSRKILLLVLLGLATVLLAVIIGLAVGLSRHRGMSDLPLPSNTQTFTGDLTYFEPGLGACGETDTSSDKIVAVSHLLFDAAGSSSADGGNSNANPLCNQLLRAERYDEQAGAMKSVDLKVVDRCVGCALYDLDTTESAFAELAPIPSGRVDVTWAWLQPVATGA